MLLRMLYDEKLAQAAYLIGCQKTGEAVIIDPERDVDRYLAAAQKEGLRITAITETHIHADFLSGARELAERTGATLYLSDEGDADWKYQWLDKRQGGGVYKHRLLKDGDSFRVGNIDLRAVHTPGHTPEHICFLVTDRGGGAADPMGIVSGDFVFVGDLGRPDLLETAAGVKGAMDPSARRLHKSVEKFSVLPDYLQVWPGHGAGSACGKALGAVPQTTVGYEKRFNPAIAAAMRSEGAFVDFILSGQPEPPLYFARMKRDNKAGPRVLGELPRPRRLGADELKALDARKVAIVDTRPWKAFKAGHVPGSLFIPVDSQFPTLAASYIQPEEQVHLVIDPARLDEAIRDMVRVGIDNIVGWFDASDMESYERTGGRLATTAEIDVAEARTRHANSHSFFLDVRRADEVAQGRIPGAHNAVHTRLPERLGEIPRNRPIVVNCRSGVRSARACALLQRAGYEVANLAGGYLAWEAAEKPDR